MISHTVASFLALGYFAMVEALPNINGGSNIGGCGQGVYGHGGCGQGVYGGHGGYGLGGRECGGMGLDKGCEDHERYYGQNNYGMDQSLFAEDMGAQSSRGAYTDLADNYYANDFAENADCFEEVEECSKKSKGSSSSKAGSVVDSNKALTSADFDSSCMNENRVRDESGVCQNNVQDCDSMSRCQDLEYGGGCGAVGGFGPRF